MKELKAFRIPFVGLKEGSHEFEYQIDQTFFDAFEYDAFFEADLKVGLLFVKKATLLALDFSLKGTVNLPCDRSGEPFDLSIRGNLSLLVKFSEDDLEDTDEIVYLPHSAHEINVAQYVYEMIVLSVPAKRVHPSVLDGTMDAKVLEKLKAFEAVKEPREIKNTMDPRWEKLQSLLTDKK